MRAGDASASTLTINQDYGAATTESGERIEIPVGTHDYLSFFYMVRTFNLTTTETQCDLDPRQQQTEDALHNCLEARNRATRLADNSGNSDFADDR